MTWQKVLEFHVAQCAQCSGPNDGCEEGQELEQKAHEEREREKRTGFKILTSYGPTLYARMHGLLDGLGFRQEN